MKTNIPSHIFATLLTLYVCGAKAQSLDELRKQYPDDKAIMLSKTLEYNISVKDSQLNVESKESQQIEYLSSNTAALTNEFGFFHSDFQRLVAYEAYTRTPGNKKLKVNDFKTSTSKESFVFYDDLKETTFNFPAIEAGAIGNLTVSWQNKDPHLLTPFYFSNYLPTLRSELKINVSKDVALQYMLAGLDTGQISVSIDRKHNFNMYTFTCKNCAADRRYGDAPGQAWYSPHVIFYIKNYRDERGDVVPYLSTANDLYRLNSGFIRSINRSIGTQLRHVVDSLTADEPNLENRARKIYSWVQHQIKYIAFEEGMEGFVPRDANLVCSRRFGDCKDMASILTLMLNTAGIPAHFSWVGTRDLPYKFSQLPLPIVSNHMICTIELNGQYIFLDGTDPTCVFGFPSHAIQGKEAMVSFSDSLFRILTVPEVEKNKNELVDSTWLELDEKNIKGVVKKDFTGYLAMRMYGTLMYSNEKTLRDEMKDEFARGSNKFQLDTFEVKKETNNSVELNARFTLPDYAKKIGDEYYVNLNLFKFYVGDEIDFPKRKMPIEYDFKDRKKYVILLKIPEGFKVSYLPQSKTYQNDVWGFTLTYGKRENWVILTQEFDDNSLLLTADKFELWNKTLENLFPLYKESLSLAKIQ